MREYTTEAVNTLRTNKMTVYDPSPQFKAELSKMGETMLDEWLKKAGADGQAIITSFRK
jgi:TRAP-type C4-dicarboxylate transport system substrate-binding protein